MHWPGNAELQLERAGVAGVFKLCQPIRPVVWVDAGHPAVERLIDLGFQLSVRIYPLDQFAVEIDFPSPKARELLRCLEPLFGVSALAFGNAKFTTSAVVGESDEADNA